MRVTFKIDSELSRETRGTGLSKHSYENNICGPPVILYGWNRGWECSRKRESVLKELERDTLKEQL